jgi:hypothetical protein
MARVHSVLLLAVLVSDIDVIYPSSRTRSHVQDVAAGSICTLAPHGEPAVRADPTVSCS